MNKLIFFIFLLLCILFTCMCYQDFSYKKKIISNYYLVEDDGAPGKSLMRYTDVENIPIFLINGNINQVLFDEKSILIKRVDKSDVKYYLIDTKLDKFIEDIEVISEENYDSISISLDTFPF